MAKIVGGIATSHTPTIGFALDTGKQTRPGVGADLRRLQARAAVARGQEARRAVLHLQRSRDLVLLRSLLALRARHRRPSTRSRTKAADRARCRRSRGIPGSRSTSPPASWPTSSTCRISRARGSTTARSRRCRCSGRTTPTWPGAIVPLQVGVLEFPMPTARRCFKLGRSLRKAIQSYPEDIKVAIVGTGGLSHQVHGERAGFNNTPWDMEFMDTLVKDPEKLTDITIADYADARRSRGLRGGHVADHARRARAQGEEAPPGVLPAVDDADRHADPARTTVRMRRANPCPRIASASARSSRASKSSKAPIRSPSSAA